MQPTTPMQPRFLDQERLVFEERRKAKITFLAFCRAGRPNGRALRHDAEPAIAVR